MAESLSVPTAHNLFDIHYWVYDIRHQLSSPIRKSNIDISARPDVGELIMVIRAGNAECRIMIGEHGNNDQQHL
jgi:hypothetical protein